MGIELIKRRIICEQIEGTLSRESTIHEERPVSSCLNLVNANVERIRTTSTIGSTATALWCKLYQRNKSSAYRNVNSRANEVFRMLRVEFGKILGHRFRKAKKRNSATTLNVTEN
jgi:hypothetical protein